ncbi:MAG: hypothetical protein HUJ67_04465 [Ruminiclostridium sp.]|nr:hypothetical protein [Ruminiclostridium sp.]
MKTKMKKAVSLLLAAALLAGLGGSALATQYTGRNYDTYLCLGDSIAAGCAVPKTADEAVEISQNPETETHKDMDIQKATEVMADYDASLNYVEYMYHGYNFEVVPRAYHSLVAEHADTFIQGAVSGTRAVELRYLLDGVYNDPDKGGFWGRSVLGTDGSVAQNCAVLDKADSQLKGIYGVNMKEAVEKADLITINYGSNDVLSLSMLHVLEDLQKEYRDDAVVSQILSQYTQSGDVYLAFAKVLQYEATCAANKVNSLLSNFAKNLISASIAFKTNYAAILKDIYAMNPDVTVVSVGIYNPFSQMKLSDTIDLKLDALMAPIIKDLNLYLKSFQGKYSTYQFADCSGVEVYDMDMSSIGNGDFITRVHPTLESHQYMADQILAAAARTQQSSSSSTAINNNYSKYLDLLKKLHTRALSW